MLNIKDRRIIKNKLLGNDIMYNTYKLLSLAEKQSYINGVYFMIDVAVNMFDRDFSEVVGEISPHDEFLRIIRYRLNKMYSNSTNMSDNNQDLVFKIKEVNDLYSIDLVKEPLNDRSNSEYNILMMDIVSSYSKDSLIYETILMVNDLYPNKVPLRLRVRNIIACNRLVIYIKLKINKAVYCFKE